MRKGLILLAAFFFSLLIQAQERSETEAVIRAIQTMFDGMRASDSSAVRSVFMPDAVMQTTLTDAEGRPQLRQGSLERFLVSVGTPKEKMLDERIWSYDVRVDGNLATAWTEYSFFVGDQFSHCGYNAFQLFKTPEGWKIFHIADTRRKDNCKLSADDLESGLHAFIDNWHHAAAVADEETFFGSMTHDAVYIGTDASERWLRDELRQWATSAFERESAWAFKAKERKLYLSSDRQLAWWNETLDTWMGTCRGSGILEQTPEGWKIKHYHLSVTVPNEKIQDFIQLVKP